VSEESPSGQRVVVRREADVARVVQLALAVGEAAGLGRVGAHSLATAASELATNIVRYAGAGAVTLRALPGGVELVAEDEGPGIEDVDAALRDHCSTQDSLGLGLPGVRRLMDEFTLETEPGRGTRVVARKRVGRG